jgi:hypothetical protein
MGEIYNMGLEDHHLLMREEEEEEEEKGLEERKRVEKKKNPIILSQSSPSIARPQVPTPKKPAQSRIIDIESSQLYQGSIDDDDLIAIDIPPT